MGQITMVEALLEKSKAQELLFIVCISFWKVGVGPWAL